MNVKNGRIKNMNPYNFADGKLTTTFVEIFEILRDLGATEKTIQRIGSIATFVNAKVHVKIMVFHNPLFHFLNSNRVNLREITM